MPWYEYVRIALFISWGVMVLLTAKLLVVRSRWRHPLRGNGPMLYALLLVLVSVELARSRNITESPPPFVPSLLLSVVATVLITVWLWQQMELLPKWLREHIRLSRKKNPPTPSPADYTIEEDIQHGTRNG